MSILSSFVSLARFEVHAAPERNLASDDALLSVRNLSVEYKTLNRTVTAVRDVSLSVKAGEVVALVGESGSGKSTIALAIMGMLPETATIAGGSIWFRGGDLSRLSERAYSGVRGRSLGWVPQDPMVTLNPLHRVGQQVAEPLRIHRLAGRKEAWERAVALLDRVHISEPKLRAHQFPHELSGGMRQRVLIAAALGPEPELIIADEPTTALDVTVQKQILDDIGALTVSAGISMLIITHDLAMAGDRADRIVVLRDGQVVEEGTAREVLVHPKEAYTRLLLASAPSLSAGRRRHDRGGDASRAGPAATTSANDAETNVLRSGKLLSVRGISCDFVIRGSQERGHILRAVDDVSFDIERGKTLGIVGESGSGKSTIARIVLGLTRPSAGTVAFDGADIGTLDRAERRRLRRLVQPIYQNPYASLDPRLSVAEIISEPLKGFRLGDRATRSRRTLELLDQVGLPRDFADRRPIELSGGQRQRVAIARALAPNPILVVCDEPVSALDVSVQSQILDLLAELQQRHQLSYLFISHDLAVVRQVADDVAVIKDGKIVEVGAADTIFGQPKHDYTRLLLDSIPGKRLRVLQ